MNNFVHLHVHTHFSLLDGLTKIDELIDAAKSQGSPAVAMTDHGVMYGAVEFYQKCVKAGIKPIVGLEGYMAPRSRFDKASRIDEKTNYHLLLLAKNKQGYKNLLKLTTVGHLEGFYYKPRFDWETLQKYHEGIIASSACLGGEIPTLIRSGRLDKAKERILEFNALFGQGNYYLELMHHPELENMDKVNNKLIEFSRELGVPLIATNDVHYLKREDAEAQDILLCLQNKKKREDTDRMSMTESDYSFKSNKEMFESFKHVPEAIENTLKIAEKCNLKIELGHVQLPFFEVKKGYSEAEYLRKLCEEGLEKRYDKNITSVDKEIKERMEYELSVIEKMGWPSYFLIVADFVNWAKNNNIIVGPGRGSAAGSLVCYLTGITNLDPLKYNLLFERFLNPDRVSMPDIDLDFADARRDEVIKYVEDKYGKDRVSQIITFGTMAARAAVRDVGRVLGVSYDFCDKLAKAIPMFVSIDKALKSVAEFRELYQNEAEAKQIIDYARRLEGVSRHASTHACGVLITKDPLVDHTPLQYASSADRSIVSQYSLHPIEALGLLKMDFLGLKNLTIIESAVRIIKNIYNNDIDIDKIPLDDKKTFHLFQKGGTTGVFQFESSGMKRYLKELVPTELEDIIAMVALYRPGPMELIPDFIAGKHGIKKVTYGVAIYQEQVMQMARDLAGFSMAEADVLRKAVGKKIVKLLEQQKQKFIDGCVKNKISSQLAKKIFSFIEPFAGYGFNRSHAACYAMVAYQTAYLKAHYPLEFMAALLSADQQNIDRISVEIEECQRMGIEVAGPDVNESFESFTVVPVQKETGDKDSLGSIRFGLCAIKNIGEHIAKVIIKERKSAGMYQNISDFLERITDKDLNKKSLESLIKSGSLSKFGERGMMLANVELMLSYNKEHARSQANGQPSLFPAGTDIGEKPSLALNSGGQTPKSEKLAWEKELLGLYISAHPFSDFRPLVSDFIMPLREIATVKKGEQIRVGGVISKIKKIITRTNKSMLFVKIEDETGNVEVLVFPNLYLESQQLWEEGRVVAILGRLSDKDQDLKILANKALLINADNLEQIKKSLAGSAVKNGRKKSFGFAKDAPLRIMFFSDLAQRDMETIKNILSKYTGAHEVFFEINVNGKNKTIKTPFKVNNTEYLRTELKTRLKDLIGLK